MFQSAFAEKSGLFHVQLVLDIERDLQVEAYRQSWQRVASRHAALRTSFRDLQGREPQQIVNTSFDICFAVDDWRGLSPGQQRDRLRSYKDKDLAEGFSLDGPPPWRIHLARLDEARYQAVWSLHYIILDARSQTIILREVEAFYAHLTGGRPLDLPPAVPFAEYVSWLSGRHIDQAERYWRTALEAVAPAAPLPVERKATGAADSAVGHGQIGLRLDEDETARLRAAGERHGLDLETLIRGCWALLLSRYTGSKDVVVGVTASGRSGDLPGIDGMVGLFINTLPLRVPVPGAMPWPEWMRLVRERYAQIQRYEHSPLLLVQQWSGIGSGNALFDTVLSIEDSPWRESETNAPYALNVVASPGERLGLTIHFDSQRFDAHTVEAMLEHLRHLCADLVRLPGARLAELSLLDERESNRLVYEWNDTHAPYSDQMCIHELFERRARLSPDAVALVHEDRSWTYAELNARANRIAHYLKGLGVGRGTQVAILMERSMEMVPALLGVLKAGGAYVPLQTNAPAKRWHWILDALGITCVLTQHALAPAIRSAGPLPRLAHVVCLDPMDAPADIARMPAEDLPPQGTSKDLAYIIFTSGSTGTPKGVMVEHYAAVNLIEWVNTTFAVGPDDRQLFITSLSFDLSVYDIFGILAAGGSIRLAVREDIQDPARLLHILATEPITFWDSAPAALMQLVPFLPAGGEPADRIVSHSLRLIFMSGDWIPVNSPAIMAAAFPNVRVVGLGGATEATVWSNFFPIDRVDPSWTSIPYGKPIQNAHYYILDEALRPCPVDVPGDLYIGGICTSLGYAGDPALTAGKYIASPFGDRPGARIYKTGDMARWRPDGNMEFLGRTDSQVKIRGYRIELGEIDTVTARHPVVKDAATVVRDDSLHSYVVLDQVRARAAVQSHEAGLLDDRIQHWQDVYDTFDQQEVAEAADGADYTGWNSSYTGQAIPLAEMEAWRQDTLALVLSYEPRDILEIGCGTGLLLFPLAEDARSYRGTDFSATVLESVRARLDARPELGERVTLLHRQADELGDLPAGAVDTVLVNSVVQYFPDVDYLLRVLDGALDRVAPGGRIVVGDVRSLPLLEAFHADIELSRADGPATRQQVLQRVRQRVQREKELTLDPRFFRDWAAGTGRVSRVEVRVKGGRQRTEMSRFRYQVVLHIGQPVVAQPAGVPELDWSGADLTLARLRERLAKDGPDRLRLRNVPNDRVAAATQGLRWLKGETTLETVDAWRAEVRSATGIEATGIEATGEATGVEPEDIRELAEQLGYRAAVGWADHGADGSYTVLLSRDGAVDEEELIAPGAAVQGRDWQGYANHPLRAEIEDLVVPQIRAYLAERLPEYMVPAELVVLDVLPVTPSGKLDRKALPLAHAAKAAGSTYAPSRNTTEALLVSIYEQVLSRSPIGIHDDFFELGGHSLLAVQLVARLRRVFGVELPVRTFFDLPTIARLTPEIHRLQDEAQPLHLPPLLPVPRTGGPLPASLDQQRLWFLDRLNPGSNFYTVNWLIPWSAELPPAVLEAGLHALVGRHESLRTTLHEEDGQVWQTIAADWRVDLPVVDLSELDPGARQARAEELIHELWARPFDLVTGPLLRTMLITLSPAERVLVLGAHHTVFDGYSIGLFGEELLRLCRALADGAPDPLPELAVQYADYAVWQQNWLAEEWIQHHLGYWKQQLAEAPEMLTLPTDFPRPEAQRYRGSFLRRQLPAELTGRVRRFSGEAQVTNYITMLAGAAVLLSRHSGQDVVVIGVPIANRHRVELETMVGFLVNTVALCVDLRGNPTFSDVLVQVRRQLFDAQSHQEIPFEKVVEALRPERDLGHNPIFQVMVADESLPMLEHVSVQPAPWMRDLMEEGMSLRVARFDLSLLIQEDADGVRLGLEYNTDLFAGPTVARLADRFEALLDAALARPDAPVRHLPVLPEAERAQLLDQWSGAGAVTGADPEYLHELFAAQARRTPDAIAVTFEEQQLTYAELDARANQLAHWLRARGVGPDVLVGLCMERSAEILVGVLGILKAGGGYVPMDPEHPADRLAFVVEDASLGLVLTQSRIRGRLSAPTLCLDTEWSAVTGQPRHAPDSGLAPENVLYIIYTSGSTGRPKGVMVTHRGINAMLAWQRADPCFSRPQRVLQIASYSFDFSIWEFIMLLAGGSLHFPRPDLRMIGTDLHDILVERAIENLNITPAALATLPRARLPHLRALFVGGEAFSAELVRAWAPGRTFVNLYGPSEITVFATAARLDESLGAPHMGRHINDVELYILDPYRQPVPVGVPGELYIGGIGVSRGYLNRPELTAEHFVANPFGTGGSRLYKSGDLVKYLPDGNIEFLGRVDQQVKIRGFRIELGEIESALAEHPQVSAAAVLVHGEGGAKRLVAYLVSDEAPAPEAVRIFLGERLPSYMVPSIFVPIDRLPLNSSGKVDRRALAAVPWERYAVASKGDYAAPRNPVEEQLARVWQDVLGIADPVGIRDNFFVLGGDSIVSLQVIFRAKQAGLHFSVKHLFQYQTIAELAPVIQLRVGVRQDAADVRAEQGPVTGPTALTPIQRWFFDQDLAQAHHFNQALLLDVSGEVTPERWQQILLRLLAHHDGLRARYVRGSNDGWQAELAEPPQALVLPVHDHERLPDVVREIQSSLDLAEAPLFRAALFTNPNKLLLIAHHLVVDVVSWRVILEDLATLSAGGELPAKSSSWQQWAERLRREQPLDELAYWLEQVEPPAKPVPLDGPDEGNTIGRSRVHEAVLGLRETQALLHDVPAAFNTRVNDVLLTAVAAAIGAWTGDTHVRVDLEGHGREDLFDEIDLSRTAGWFTTISPVRLPVPPEAALGEGLKEVKELLRRRPRQGIGYGLLRFGGTEAGARLAAAPAAQVSFNHLGAFDGADSFAAAYEAVGWDIGPDNRRAYLVDIVSRVQDGQLRVQWTYQEGAHRAETIERVARHALDALTRLAAEARRPDVSGYSPSDLPVGGLGQAEIDDLVGQLQVLPAWRDGGTARPLADCYPQTPLQQGLWFQSQYAQGEGLYHVQMIHEIDQPLRVDAFRQAWAEAMRRHAILRTSFWATPDHPALQLVWRQVPVPLEVVDWRSGPAPELLEDYLQRDRLRGFEPHEIPQWRMLLARTGDDAYRLVFSMHHAILDGWSYALLLAEVVQAYEAVVSGRQQAAPPTRPYRDYVAWFEKQDLAQAGRYWQEALAGAGQASPLSIERHGGAEAAPAGARRHAEVGMLLGEQESTRLQELAQRHGLTLNTVLQGCWALLLGRYDDTDDVTFGVVVSGRPADIPEVERMTGLFINTLPLRVRLPAETPWIDWIRGIQERNLQMRQYEFSSLDRVRRWSGLPTGAELFNTLFVFENYPVEQARDTALRLAKPRRAEERVHYPLGVVATVRGRQLHVLVQYDPQRFERETVDRVLAHLRYLCAQIAETPEAPLAKLSILTPEERLAVLQQGDDPEDELLAEVLAEIEGLSPDDLLLEIEKSEAHE